MNEAPAAAPQAKPRKRRPKATPEEKADWAKRFTDSGLKQREFCRQHGLVLTTLQRWLAQVQGHPWGGTESKAGFVEVKLGPAAAPGRWAAELCASNGRILRLAHDVPAELLQQLLRAC
jgi:hypothetical protein